MMKCKVKLEVSMNGYGYPLQPMMRTPCSYCEVPQTLSQQQFKMPSMNTMPEQYMMPAMHDMKPEYEMPESLEIMYPKSYMIIYPHIKHHCRRLEMMHGGIHHIAHEDIEEACENIMKACEGELKEYMKDEGEHSSESEHSHDHRQYGYGGYGFAGDLVRILLLRELLGHRRRPYPRPYPYHHYYREYPTYEYFNYDYDF
jgi:hypothetical protein